MSRKRATTSPTRCLRWLGGGPGSGLRRLPVPAGCGERDIEIGEILPADYESFAMAHTRRAYLDHRRAGRIIETDVGEGETLPAHTWEQLAGRSRLTKALERARAAARTAALEEAAAQERRRVAEEAAERAALAAATAGEATALADAQVREYEGLADLTADELEARVVALAHTRELRRPPSGPEPRHGHRADPRVAVPSAGTPAPAAP